MGSETRTAPVRPLAQELSSYCVVCATPQCLSPLCTNAYGSFSISLFNIYLFNPQLALANPFLPSTLRRCPGVIQCPWRSPLRMLSTTHKSCSPFWFPCSLRRSCPADEQSGPSLRARHMLSTTLQNHEVDFELSDS